MAKLNEACPICALTADGKIEKNIIWSSEPCNKCKDLMKQGFVLIGAVEKKTTDVTNPYRSGNVWVVKQEVADTLFAPNPPPASGVSFIDVTVAAQMELPGVNLKA